MNETPSLHDIILPHSRVNEWEKDALLENLPNKEVDVKETKSLGFKELKIAMFIFLALLFLCVPKIYLSNTIYYLSKDIVSLQTQHDILLDENKRLKHEIETLRYRFLILNEF